jgi:ribonuclease D
MGSDKMVKIFHNCKFDLKFLMNWGIQDFKNIEDTQIIHSLVDENLPHGLKDLVKQYFPKELDTF